MACRVCVDVFPAKRDESLHTKVFSNGKVLLLSLINEHLILPKFQQRLRFLIHARGRSKAPDRLTQFVHARNQLCMLKCSTFFVQS